jgi:hypothetical protein
VKKTRSRSLIALSTSALALPGIASADAPPVETTLAYKISNYQEDDLSRSEAPFGDLERYDIDVHQFQLLSPIGRNTAIQVYASHETLSGASPWFTSANIDGNPIVSLSGASGIDDKRSELSVGGRYYLENGTIGANVGYSEEDDYKAIYFGIDGERHFNNDLTTVAIGFSYSSDELFLTDAVLFNRVIDEDKRSASLVASISQVINQVSTIQSAISITELNGFLSDPYKLRDVRPDDKTQFAWSTSYRRFFDFANAALHIDYRLYHDDFGISSHTLELAWHQNLNRSWQLVPAVRYYSQSAADFFTNIDDFLNPLPNYQSSDYRLAAFGAFSGGLSVIGDFGDWSANLTAERYVSNDKYSAYEVSQPSTALTSYYRVSLGIEFAF